MNTEKSIIKFLTAFDEKMGHLNTVNLIQEALQFITVEMKLKRASVAMLEPNKSGFIIRDVTFNITELENGRFLPFASTHFSKLVKNLKPIYRQDIKQYKPAYEIDAKLMAGGLVSDFVVPLIINGKCIGTLNSGSTEVDGISEYNRQLLALIAPKLAQALRNAKLHEKLLESEEKFRGIFDNAGDGILYVDKNVKVLDTNPAFTEITGISKENVLGKSGFELAKKFVNLKELPQILNILKSIIINKPIKPYILNYRDKILEISSRKKHEGDNSIGIIRDITERKRAEEKLKKLSTAIKQSPVSVVITDPKGNIEYVNPKFCELTGYSEKEALGKNPRILQSGQTPKQTYEQLWEALLGGKEWHGEFLNKKKNGELYWEDAIISPILNEKGDITNFLAVKEDITERKRTEKQLQKSLTEKDILIKEIYHRVKNNLAVVSGILNLQTKFIEDKKAIDSIRETQIRVTSMAMVHSHLSDSENYTKIEYKKYIKTLVTNIFHSLKMSEQVKLHFDLDDIILPIDKAMPCGLLLNEIVSNALKHAFPDNRKGNLRIIMSSLENKNCEIIVKDDGVGLPANFHLEKSKTFGLKLINVMSKQFHGTIEIISDKGTEFRIQLNTEAGQVIR